MRSTFIKLTFLIVVIAGCHSTDENQWWANQFVQGSSYLHDPRTNLCFVRFGNNFTNVPCERIPVSILARGRTI